MTDLVIIIGFILYTVLLLAIGYCRGYNSCFNDASMLFLEDEMGGDENDG